MERTDVIVVGLGALGSAAAWRLARRGVQVVGVDQFEPGHPWGGSHGRTRLFRVACLEHPGLVPIALRARELWRELGVHSGQELLLETGGLMIGPPGSRIIEGTLAAARAHGLPVEVLTPEQIAQRAPGHARVAPGDIGVWDPDAGVLRPEAAIVAATEAARAAGAELVTGQRVRSVEPDADGVTVHLADRELRADRVVVAAGPWLATLLPGVPLTPHRYVMTWFRPRPGHRADLDHLPVFIRRVPETDDWVWGHGALPGDLAKVGDEFDGPFEADDPNDIDRVIHAGETDHVASLVAATFDDLDPQPAEQMTCVMAHTPDGQFLLGPSGGSDRVIVAGGCSGHSFKHAAALGELAAQWACGEPRFTDTAFLDPRRFTDSARG
ncbi:N-methyl-L-tryptophan oxidase [Ornithinimicrobium sp. F0845]|uniref:N-methyl-L-tryptophan oxidase n=1 Tax=Ornithinimicrobium sp. F0845 TaxID=2926412 RepID=UPI001FF6C971|nr:N-methyl-L-tryptophan oxidase [Ornithinimicrobium sp. F0845]MCK0113384.1 N-methyl-L-tryptophan oxidase [Ornithinimicrobium sp. F0845]